MKRKEALLLIENIYDQFVEDWIKADLRNLDGFVPLSERILSALEKEGMLPPFTYLKNLGTLDTTWEPEEEEKND